MSSTAYPSLPVDVRRDHVLVELVVPPPCSRGRLPGPGVAAVQAVHRPKGVGAHQGGGLQGETITFYQNLFYKKVIKPV